jgi:hypothetical protein
MPNMESFYYDFTAIDPNKDIFKTRQKHKRNEGYWRYRIYDDDIYKIISSMRPQYPFGPSRSGPMAVRPQIT